MFPASHCPSCGVPIHFYDNIPVVSYLVLRGRCRSCGSGISPRYPVIEFITGAMALALVAVNVPPLATGPSISALPWFNALADFTLACILLAAFAIDLEHMIIPDRLNLAGGVLGVLFSLRWGVTGLVRGALGALVGLAVLGFVALFGRLIYRREAMGLGDLKLALVIGVFVGPFWAFMTFLLSILLGGLWGIVLIVTGRLETGREIPFGPFIAMAGYCVLFFKPVLLFIVDRYMGLF